MSDHSPEPAWVAGSVHLYVHFPYCARRCTYCDFNTYVPDTIPRTDVTRAILREGAYRSPPYASWRLQTIYFGGGTPSLWGPEGISAVVQAAATWFPDRADAVEVTLECNPAEVSPELLARYRAAGVTRLSLGIQALEDRLLRPLYRRHTAAEGLRALDTALAAGFDSVTADLMFGLPGQRATDWSRALTQLAQTGVPHISHYHLTLESGTAMTRDVARGRTILPHEDEAADMFEAIAPTLAPFGLRPYEISSSARAGHRSGHNCAYWLGRPYLGLGAGAHSFLPPKTWTQDPGAEKPVALRRSTRKHHAVWLAETLRDGAAVVFEEALDRDTHLRERLFTGLRHLPGFSLSRLGCELDLNVMATLGTTLRSLQARGLVQRRGDILRLTEQGLRIADTVFEAIVAA